MKYLKFFYVICFISLIFIIVDRHSRGKEISFLVFTALIILIPLTKDITNRFKLNKQKRKH